MSSLETTELKPEILNALKARGYSTEIFGALKNSLYPGAKDESVLMVLDYCKAAGLDPMQKPVHIVPIGVKTGTKDRENKDIYENRDTIMPGIGLYRTQASRSGLHLGTSKPEFGEMITQIIGKEEITYPKSCRIVVKKLLADGSVAEFEAEELWIENYAPKSRYDTTPNSMWMKRKCGQLAKCTEAQALRKAFPEFITSHITAEEMEGKFVDYDGSVDISKPNPVKGLEDKLNKNKAIEKKQDQLANYIPKETVLNAIKNSKTLDELKEADAYLPSMHADDKPEARKSYIDKKTELLQKEKQSIASTQTDEDFMKELNGDTK